MIVQTLADRFRECRSDGLEGIPRAELLRYMEQAARILDDLNGPRQTQYLDVNPQNLILDGDHLRLAHAESHRIPESTDAAVTPPGITPVYAAPETFDGVVSRQCDQYSLAVVYQELLTGRRPFRGTSFQQVIMQHLTASPDLAVLPLHDRPSSVVLCPSAHKNVTRAAGTSLRHCGLPALARE